jgi:hypothetical protein
MAVTSIALLVPSVMAFGFVTREPPMPQVSGFGYLFVGGAKCNLPMKMRIRYGYASISEGPSSPLAINNNERADLVETFIRCPDTVDSDEKPQMIHWALVLSGQARLKSFNRQGESISEVTEPYGLFTEPEQILTGSFARGSDVTILGEPYASFQRGTYARQVVVLPEYGRYDFETRATPLLIPKALEKAPQSPSKLQVTIDVADVNRVSRLDSVSPSPSPDRNSRLHWINADSVSPAFLETYVNRERFLQDLYLIIGLVLGFCGSLLVAAIQEVSHRN